MLRTIEGISYLFLYMFSRLPYYWRLKRLAKQGRLEERQAIIDEQVSVWARRLLRHIKIDVTVEGRENLPAPGEVVVFASNHQSYLDIPVLLANIEPPPPLLARRDLGQIPLLGLWMRQLGCVFVQREDARSGMTALRHAQQVVEEGRSLVVFPEGTRSRGDGMNTFQAGAVRIAAKARVPVVPVAIDGSFRGFEAGGGRICPTRLRLCFLPRVETQSLTREEQKKLPETIQEMVRRAKDDGDANGE